MKIGATSRNHVNRSVGADAGQDEQRQPEDEENEGLAAPIQGTLAPRGDGSPRTSVRS